jgi:periplasmic divalent cation tolerance protein
MFAYVPVKDRKEAREISRKLLERKLVACANYFPIESMYLSEGRVKDIAEYILILKTTQKLYADVEKAVIELHSYKICCVAKVPAEYSLGYRNWMDLQLQKK